MDIRFHVESAVWLKPDKSGIRISGWMFDMDGSEMLGVRLNCKEQFHDGSYCLHRPDVARAFMENDVSDDTGFLLHIGKLSNWENSVLEYQISSGEWCTAMPLGELEIEECSEPDPYWDPAIDARHPRWKPKEPMLNSDKLQEIREAFVGSGLALEVSLIWSLKTHSTEVVSQVIQSILGSAVFSVELIIVSQAIVSKDIRSLIDDYKGRGFNIVFGSDNLLSERQAVEGALAKCSCEWVVYLSDDLPLGSHEIGNTLLQAGWTEDETLKSTFNDLVGLSHSERLVAANRTLEGTNTSLLLDGFLEKSNSLDCIAFYLPQYHPIDENNAWWGEGFTEWTNVGKSQSFFDGHNQPNHPSELGYYDLRLPEVWEKQVDLAKRYGITGFCFYHYWFNGKRLLEKPVDEMLKTNIPNFPFCLCWANENWTRRWDGMEKDVLIKQEYSDDSDRKFLEDLIPFLSDKRYIRIDGNPLVLVYRIELLPDPKRTAEIWRGVAKEHGFDGLHLLCIDNSPDINPPDMDFDGKVEFSPWSHQALVPVEEGRGERFQGKIYDYNNLAHIYEDVEVKETDYFRCVSPSWDNTPRRGESGSVFIGSTPERYRKWLSKAAEWTLREKEISRRFLFINAWNEWAEGCYLEPDRRNERKYLEATRDALRIAKGFEADSAEIEVKRILFISHDFAQAGAQLLLLRFINWLENKNEFVSDILFNVDRSRSDYCSKGEQTILDAFADIGSCYFLDDIAHEPENLALVNSGYYDFIYANTSTLGSLLAFFQDVEIPVLSHIHEMDFWIGNFVDPQDFEAQKRHTSKFLACSEPVCEVLTQKFGIDDEQVEVIHASTSLEETAKIVEGLDRDSIREELGVDAETCLIVLCGTYYWRKGSDLFLPLLMQLQKLSNERKFKVLWVGGYGEEANKLQFDYDIRRLGMEENAVLCGSHDTPQKLMFAADCFLLPSREDPFPLVMLEAASLGLPIVGFENTGGFKTFYSNEAGLGVPYLDVEAMAASVWQVWDDPQLRDKLSANAKSQVSLYDQEISFTKTYDLILKLLNQPV